MRAIVTALVLLVVGSAGALGALNFDGVTSPYGFVTSLDFHGQTGCTSCQTGYVLRTTNGGVDWEKVTLPPELIVAMFDVEVLDANKVVIVGSGHIAYSSDAGATWSDAGGSYFALPATQRGDLYRVSFDGDHGMAVGINREGGPLTLLSTDGGHTWSETASPDPADLPADGRWRAADVVYRSSGNSYVCGSGGRLFSWDGSAWHLHSLTTPAGTPHLVCLFPAPSGRLYVGTTDGYLISDRIASDWTAPTTKKIEPPAGAGNTIHALWLMEDARGKPQVIVSRFGNTPAVSWNGGTTWQEGVLSPPTAGLWCLAVRSRVSLAAGPARARPSLQIWVGGMGKAPTPAGLWRAVSTAPKLLELAPGVIKPQPRSLPK